MQYAVHWVNLDPTVGSEIKKTRPCVIVSPNEINRHLQTVIVAPLTSTHKAYPTRVAVRVKGKKGEIVLEQLRAIDRRRIGENMGALTASEISACKKVLREMLVD